MVYKIYSSDGTGNSVEFIKQDNSVLISSQDNSDLIPENIVNIVIDKETLFELIGGLLRIQSKFKNENNDRIK